MKYFEKRRKRKEEFERELERDVNLLIEHGYIKIDPTAKKPTFKEFETAMREWGFIE